MREIWPRLKAAPAANSGHTATGGRSIAEPPSPTLLSLMLAPVVATSLAVAIATLGDNAIRAATIIVLSVVFVRAYALMRFYRPSRMKADRTQHWGFVLDATMWTYLLSAGTLAIMAVRGPAEPFVPLLSVLLLILPFRGTTVSARTHASLLGDLKGQRDQIVLAGKYERLARFDSLTGVENRMAMQMRLRALFETNHKQRDAFALIWIDLDRFKEINDSLGHMIGDKLLCIVSEKLCEALDGRGHVARFGGDEFVLLCPDVNRDEVLVIANDILDQFRHSFEVEGHDLIVTTSMGIGIGPQDGRDADELMRHADIALYQAKREGRDRAVLFNWSMKERHNRVHDIETGLRHAIENSEMHLLFQPIFHLKDGSVDACEALLRWDHPTLGRVPPSEFIPIAEKIGMIEPITMWVLGQACAAATQWPEHVRIAVNISAVSLQSPDLARRIIAILLENNLPARRVELEVTETVFLEDNRQTHQMLRELQLIGLKLVLDDFGTGYSSLSYIRSYRFDTVKIDQSFMEGISDSPQDQAIIRAISFMAEALQMDTVAEGIETEDQLRHANNAGFQRGQGFLLCPPLPADAVLDIIAAGPHAALAAAPETKRRSA